MLDAHAIPSAILYTVRGVFTPLIAQLLTAPTTLTDVREEPAGDGQGRLPDNDNSTTQHYSIYVRLGTASLVSFSRFTRTAEFDHVNSMNGAG